MLQAACWRCASIEGARLPRALRAAANTTWPCPAPASTPLRQHLRRDQPPGLPTPPSIGSPRCACPCLPADSSAEVWLYSLDVTHRQPGAERRPLRHVLVDLPNQLRGLAAKARAAAAGGTAAAADTEQGQGSSGGLDAWDLYDTLDWGTLDSLGGLGGGRAR